MSRAVIVIGVAACGTPAAPATPVAAAPTTCSPLTTAPPKTFGKLFCAGASWTLQGLASVETPPNQSGEREQHQENGPLTCSVGFPRQLAGGWSAAFDCTTTIRLVARFPSELVATPAGLWDLGTDDLAKLDPKRRLIAEPPIAFQRFDDSGVESGEDMTVWRKDDAWCFAHGAGGFGYSSQWALCMKNGELVGARSVGNDDEIEVAAGWGILPPS